jgi:GcrA cell cycle regulator
MTKPKRPKLHDLIAELAPTHTAPQIAELIPLTAGAIRKHCARHSIEIKPSNTARDWTAIDKAIRAGAAEPVSMHVVGERLGMSRNAIAGRAARIGVEFRTRAPRSVLSINGVRGNAKQRSGKPPKPVPVARMKWGKSVSHAPVAPTFINPVEEAGVVTMLELGAHHCKWPIGDPASVDFRFCGKAQADGRPYCAGHSAIAFVKPPPRKPKAEPRDNRRVAA